MIVKEVIILSNYLRNEGMSVSIRSNLVASWIIENLSDDFNLNELNNALKSVYVKNIDDMELFDKIFNKLFIKSKKENTKNNEKLNTNDTNQQNSIHSKKEILDIESEQNKLKKDQQRKKVIEEKISNDSIVQLDGYDHKVFEMCRKLSKKIANQRSKRQRNNKSSNKINFSRTIRTNLKNGGHFINLVHKKPPIHKNNHIFLCDVSGSCEWIATWFFAIIYGCQQTFNKIKIYDFDNKIIDVSDTLEAKSYESASQISSAHRSKGVLTFGQSDMTNSFKEFLDTVEINNHTDIILLTDCRDWTGKRENGELESAKILENISRKAHKVIILNPERKIRWKTSTSCVKDYEKINIPIYEIGSLDQFANVISKL